MVEDIIRVLENDYRVKCVGRVRTEERKEGYYECFSVTFADRERNHVEDKGEPHLNYLLKDVLEIRGLKLQHPVRPTQDDFLDDPTVHVEKKSDKDYSTP